MTAVDLKSTPAADTGSYPDAISAGGFSMHVTAFAHGMEVWGYGYAHSDRVDVNNGTVTDTQTARSVASKITVTRTVTGVTINGDGSTTQHRPNMEVEVHATMMTAAAVYDTPGEAEAAAFMRADCQNMSIPDATATSASQVDGAGTAGLSITLGPLRFSMNGTDNDYNEDPSAGGTDSDTAAIQTDTCFFDSMSQIKVRIPASGFLDTDGEVEAWIWDSNPYTDLHGNCLDCAAYAFAEYGTRPE